MFVLVLAATWGALRYNLAKPHFDQTSLATYNDQLKSVIVASVIVGELDVRDVYTNLRVEADHLLISNPPDGITGTVRTRAHPSTAFLRFSLWRPNPRRGQTPDADQRRRVGLSRVPRASGCVFDTAPAVGVGVMSRPRVTVLARDQSVAPLGWLAPFTGYALKARAENVVAPILPEPQAPLLTGILLGGDAAKLPGQLAAGIPKSVQEAFRTTGTSHVIAISG